MLAVRTRGLIAFRLLVDPGGRVRDCRIVRSSGNRELDAATCGSAMRRLRYAPARNTAGRPVAAWAYGEHEWLEGAPKPDQWYDAEEVRD